MKVAVQFYKWDDKQATDGERFHAVDDTGRLTANVRCHNGGTFDTDGWMIHDSDWKPMYWFPVVSLKHAVQLLGSKELEVFNELDGGCAESRDSCG